MIANLTIRPTSPELAAQGVEDLGPQARAAVRDLLTFVQVPSSEDLLWKASRLAELAGPAEEALVDGPAFLIPTLDMVLRNRGIVPVYELEPGSAVMVRVDVG